MVKGTSGGEDVVISIGGEIESLKLTLAKGRAMLKKGLVSPTAVAAVAQQAKVLGKQYNNAFTESFSAFQKTSISDVLGDSLSKRKGFDFNKKLNFSMASAAAKQFTSDLKKIPPVTKSIKKGFDMNALGIMFFGQAITRMTSTLSKAARTTFQDIMHSVEGNVTAFDQLDTSLKKIQYSMGSALAPVYQAFIPLLDAVALAVKEHPILFNTLFISLAAIGTVLSVGGALTLGLNSLNDKLLALGVNAMYLKNAVTLLKGLFAVGLIMAIGFKIFSLGLDKKATAMDWFQVLGMAGISGFILGGLPGAFITMGIVASVMLSREMVRAFLDDAVQLKKAWESVFAGTASVEQAMATGFEGTIIPQAALDYQKQSLQSTAKPEVTQQYGNLNAQPITIENLVVSLTGDSITNGVSEQVLSTITSFG